MTEESPTMSIAIPEPVSIVYKTIDEVSLSLDVYANSHTGQVKPRPAIVFFHGGGLVSSTSSHSSLWRRAPIRVAGVFPLQDAVRFRSDRWPPGAPTGRILCSSVAVLLVS
jgi:hypothetical protein